MKIATNPAVRLRPPSPLVGPRWVAVELLQRRRFALPPPGVLLCIACLQPQERAAVIEDVARRLGLSPPAVDGVARILETEHLLITAQDGKQEWFEAVRRDWTARGWSEAAEYHLLTYDYPFADYSQDGWQVDRQRMSIYRTAEPDVDRTKVYLDACARSPLPLPDEVLLPVSVSDAWQDRVEPQPLDRDALGAIMSICFGKIGEVGQRRPEMEPGLRRTSPSGGGRHPTEAYAAVLNVPGLDPGWYHVAIDPPTVELLHATADCAELTRMLPTLFHQAPFRVAAIVILTCVFERNMYRYREPRTFRSVHMDAGHLAASLELVAGARGVETFVDYAVDEVAIEEKLSVNGLQEGVMCAVALGAHAQPAP